MNTIVIPGPSDRSKNKPIYLVIVEDPLSTSKKKVVYIKSSRIDYGRSGFIEVWGQILDEAEKEDPLKDTKGKEVHWVIPGTKLTRIENVTYKGEKHG